MRNVNESKGKRLIAKQARLVDNGERSAKRMKRYAARKGEEKSQVMKREKGNQGYSTEQGDKSVETNERTFFIYRTEMPVFPFLPIPSFSSISLPVSILPCPPPIFAFLPISNTFQNLRSSSELAVATVVPSGLIQECKILV